MALVNLKKKTIQAKIVYYGPGRGGKTTNLEYLYEIFRDRIKTDMITIKTEGDRTLFFDFLPLNVGKIKGYSVSVQLYTVPGQVKYNETRRLVLRGVDGVVFVADSLKLRLKKNAMSLKNLQENLSTYKKNIHQIPLVMQYNKRDLESEGIPISTPQTLEKTLNSKLEVASFEASALKGVNVVSTLQKIITLTVESLSNEYT